MTKIEKQILKSQKRIAALKAKESEKKARQETKLKKVSRPSGRPKLKPELLAKTKGVDVLSSPRVITNPGKAATIEITQNLAAPDGSEVPLGVSLSINPTLTEKGAIAFSGRATDRFKHGQRAGESLSVLACVTREIYFKGTAASGSSVVLNAGPSTFSTVKKDGATETKSRELVIYLSFKKITAETVKKPVPAKSAKPSAKKKKS